jgi:hypothetical protein
MTNYRKYRTALSLLGLVVGAALIAVSSHGAFAAGANPRSVQKVQSTTAISDDATTATPFLIAGEDSSSQTVQNVKVNSSGRLEVVGPTAVGVAAGFNPLLVAGEDTANNVRNVKLTTSGHPIIAGAAANGAAISGNPVPKGVLAIADAAAPTAITAGQVGYAVATTERIPLVNSTHPNRVNCRLTTTATSSTAITGCGAPGAGKSIYITDINIMGGVATGATAAASIQYGTGGTCGTGTTVVFDCQHAATAGCTTNLTTPIKAAANSEVCILDATVGTKFVTVTGYIAP